MSIKRKTKREDFLGRSAQRSSGDQALLMGLLLAVSMAGLFFLWVSQAKTHFSRMKSQELLDSSQLPAYPEVPDFAIDQTLLDSQKGLEEMLEESDEELQAVGDKYAAEKGLFGPETFSTLEFTEGKVEAGRVVLSYAQYYKGVEVLGCHLSLAVALEAEEVLEVENTLAQGIDLEVDPEISLKAATALAQEELKGEGYAFRKGSLAIARYQDDYYLAWRVLFFKEMEGAEDEQEVLVGANHGGIISHRGIDELENVAE